MYSEGSDSVNTLRILSIHDSFEKKIMAFQPMWTRTNDWGEVLQVILPFITVPIVDYHLVSLNNLLKNFLSELYMWIIYLYIFQVDTCDDLEDTNALENVAQRMRYLSQLVSP